MKKFIHVNQHAYDGDLKGPFYLGQCHMGGNLVWSQDYRSGSNPEFQTNFKNRCYYE